MPRPVCLPALALIAASVAACSPRQFGIARMADALTATAGAFATDPDPEFVRHAAPATLKMVEMLLEEQPAHPGLLLAACRGFTQYAYAFLQVDSEIAQASDPGLARELRGRAARMYDRARGYCLRALELRHTGSRDAIANDPAAALGRATAADIPVLYWTAAALGGSVALDEAPLHRLGDVAAARGLLARALALDQTWGSGAIHEALIVVEGLPRLLGGSPARARRHFERAVDLSGGKSAFAYLTMAASVAEPAGETDEYVRLLQAALAIDVNERPDLRLANLIAQRKARYLLRVMLKAEG